MLVNNDVIYIYVCKCYIVKIVIDNYLFDEIKTQRLRTYNGFCKFKKEKTNIDQTQHRWCRGRPPGRATDQENHDHGNYWSQPVRRRMRLTFVRYVIEVQRYRNDTHF